MSAVPDVSIKDHIAGDNEHATDIKPKSREPPTWVKAVFLGSIGGFGLLTGFSSAIAFARKRDSKSFDDSLMQQGGRLATRALLYGTAWACAGVGLVAVAFYAAFGPLDGEPFRQRVGSILPAIPKKPIEQRGRSEFASLTELMQYIIDEDKKSKSAGIPTTQSTVKSDLP